MTGASGLSNVDIGQNDRLKWKITAPFRQRNYIFPLLSSSIFYYKLSSGSLIQHIRALQWVSGETFSLDKGIFRAQWSGPPSMITASMCTCFFVDIVSGQSASGLNGNDDSGLSPLAE